MTERVAAAPRGPYGAWLCLLVALALEVVRGQREGRGGEGRGDLAFPGRGNAPVMPPSLWGLEPNLERCPGEV